MFPTVFKTSEKRYTDISLKRSSHSTFLIPKFVIDFEIRRTTAPLIVLHRSNHYYLSYDPYGPVLNFLGKPWAKKVPYEGFIRRSDRAGKTHAALLEMRMVPQGTRTVDVSRMRINDNLKFCFFF